VRRFHVFSLPVAALLLCGGWIRLIDRPEGPFATSMLILPEILEAGLKKKMVERGY